MFRNFNAMADDVEKMQREMNRMFRRMSSPSFRMAAGYPAINTWVDGDKILMTAELPGIERDDIELSVEGDMLTITGERKALALPEDARYHRQERGCGKFTRVTQLPYQIDPKKVEARMHDGVLEIKLERAEADKPRKIKVIQG
jgi:HSP20 family protein